MEKTNNEISVRIGGQAGDGALTTGDTLALIFHRMGYFVSTYKDFPSQIRAIHTNYTIRASVEPKYARPDYLDVILAFDKESVERHSHELRPKGYIIYESTRGEYKGNVRRDVTFLNIPLRKLAIESAGKDLMKNTVALGVLSYLAGLDKKIAKRIFEERFLKRKGREVVDANIRAFDSGLKAVESLGITNSPLKLQSDNIPKGYLMMGDDAVAFGAIYAGCRFFAGYPITPASEIMERLAVYMPKYNGVVLQVEDEISAINKVIGASIAGARAMTSTSGPGFALMTEGLSYAGMTETPIVVVNCSRAGPSTGMPTKNEQSDLFHAVFGGHGDFPRIVLAPKDPTEAFQFTILAFNLAEKYQLPVILMVDQFLAQNKFSVPDLPKDLQIERGNFLPSIDSDNSKDTTPYKRYLLTETGTSPRLIPGTKIGLTRITGVEHDEYGHVTTYSKLRTAMVEKRLKKLTLAKGDLPRPVVYGNPKAKMAVLTFGSTTFAVIEALSSSKEFKVLQVRTLWPIEASLYDDLIKDCELYSVENNAVGQLAYVLEHALSRRIKRILKYNGRPFRPEEISRRLMNGDP